MHSYTIKSIIKKPDFYEISSVIGMPTCSDQSYLLPVNEKKVGNDLAARHGFKKLEDLVDMSFTSHHPCFETAMEFLLFGRTINLSDSNWVLNHFIIPALLENRTPDYRGIDRDVIQQYIRKQFDSGNMVKIEESYQYDGSKWLDAVNHVLLQHGFHVIPCTQLPETRIKGYCYYFMVDYSEYKSTYAFTASHNIITKLD